jgi:hypothetical protein
MSLMSMTSSSPSITGGGQRQTWMTKKWGLKFICERVFRLSRETALVGMA